ncbi:MAG: substrate-binding domain-containing protein [Candidatus Omnitrophica bacterium]|nr:substrate-binding domain-containing protein [Candidatus Omnitrophota bacterium]
MRQKKILLTSRRFYTFGILTTPAKDIFHSNYHLGLLSGIMPRIKAAGGRLKIIMMPAEPYKGLDQILLDHELDGLLILTWRWIHPSVVKLIETTRHSRVLVVNDPVSKLRVNSIYTDTDAGMAQAVTHLVKKGFRRIGMLHGPMSVPFKMGAKKILVPFIDTRLKKQSFLKVLKAKRVPVNKKWIRSGAANSEKEGYRVMKKWLGERDLPEAIVCGNDDLAFGALRALKECKKNMAVIGFDDNEHAKTFSPPLTTIRQPLAQMGKDAVDILIRQIEGRAVRPVSKRYRPKLVVRKTA